MSKKKTLERKPLTGDSLQTERAINRAGFDLVCWSCEESCPIEDKNEREQTQFWNEHADCAPTSNVEWCSEYDTAARGYAYDD